LDLELHLPAPGLESAAKATPPRRSTVLERESPRALDRTWATGPLQRVHEWRCADGRLDASLDRDERGTYRFYTREYGRYVVDPDGSRVRCAPPSAEPWYWQRGLNGQVLPLAAVLHGLEIFHASAVALDGRALAIVAESGVGKTSVAAHLVERGNGRLITDDVLAVELAEDGCVAHPGPALLNVRHATARALGAQRVRALGPVLGDDGEALRILADREEKPLPIGAMYFLEPATGSSTVIRATAAPDARLLLASTYNFYVKTPTRLEAQLALCAQLAADVPMFRVQVDRSEGAGELARELEAHAASAVAA
jgi:hypothetical protein